MKVFFFEGPLIRVGYSLIAYKHMQSPYSRRLEHTLRYASLEIIFTFLTDPR